MPQKRTMHAVCQNCSLPFLAFGNSKAKFCSNACVGRASARPAPERFWDRVDQSPTDWLWTGYVSQVTAPGEGGYGYFAVSKRRQELAHRYAWELASGAPVPDGALILHTCDIRHCVRNDEPGFYELNGLLLPRWGHLFAGTHLNNMEDARLKGRFVGVAEANTRRHCQARVS